MISFSTSNSILRTESIQIVSGCVVDSWMTLIQTQFFKFSHSISWARGKPQFNVLRIFVNFVCKKNIKFHRNLRKCTKNYRKKSCEFWWIFMYFLYVVSILGLSGKNYDFTEFVGIFKWCDRWIIIPSREMHSFQRKTMKTTHLNPLRM